MHYSFYKKFCLYLLLINNIEGIAIGIADKILAVIGLYKLPKYDIPEIINPLIKNKYIMFIHRI